MRGQVCVARKPHGPVLSRPQLPAADVCLVSGCGEKKKTPNQKRGGFAEPERETRWVWCERNTKGFV